MREYTIQTRATAVRVYKVKADTLTAAQDKLEESISSGDEDPDVEFYDVTEDNEEVLR